MRTEILQRNHIGGWGFSLLLHGLLLCSLWPVVRHLPVPIQLEPFRWDVTFIEESQQRDDVESTGAASLAAAPAAPAHEILQSVAAMRQDQAQPTQEILPLAHAPNNDIRETVRPIDDVTPVTAAPRQTVIASAEPEPEPAPPTPFVPDMKPMPMIQEALPVQRDATEQPHTGVSTASIAAEPAVAMTAPREEHAPLTHAPPATEAVMAPSQPRDPAPRQSAPASPTVSNQPSATLASVPPPTSDQSSASRSDYSWLQRAVSRRLEKLKRSSRPLIEEASKLKVLVRAVISHTGELMEAEVVNSSGFAWIDQEAVSLVQRAFPMPLDETLDRPQIVMRIPITYSRD